MKPYAYFNLWKQYRTIHTCMPNFFFTEEKIPWSLNIQQNMNWKARALLLYFRSMLYSWLIKLCGKNMYIFKLINASYYHYLYVKNNSTFDNLLLVFYIHSVSVYLQWQMAKLLWTSKFAHLLRTYSFLTWNKYTWKKSYAEHLPYLRVSG